MGKNTTNINDGTPFGFIFTEATNKEMTRLYLIRTNVQIEKCPRNLYSIYTAEDVVLLHYLIR